MLWPLIRFSYNTINYDLTVPSPAPPSTENWLGTDDQGRDVLARIIYGLRISLLFGLMLTFASSIVGVMVGAIQGYYGGWVDLAGQRFLEIWSSMPTLYLLIILSSFVKPGFWWLLAIICCFPGWRWWIWFGPSSCAAAIWIMFAPPERLACLTG